MALFDYDPERFLKKANDINKALHENEIPVGDRAGIMAALLLALSQDGNLRIHAEPRPLMREINGLIEDLLKKKGKEEFSEVIKLKLPATAKNHKKYRKAIIDILQHLREMNIRSAINSGDDALGKFYETFLKYANGAKEMGIVLTPRHITKFAVDSIGVGPRDRVFDPACGTGGFLISAMESIRKSSPNHYDKFRNDGLFGVEQRDDVYGLAIVNMIFRKDGRSRLYDGNCFDHDFWLRDGDVWYILPGDRIPEGGTKPFSRVLMNPPFKLKNNPETSFVDYGLEQMREGGMFFSVLPTVVIGGKKHSGWRQEILKRHRVMACIRFDKNLFYPIAETTYGLILRAHQPHDLSNPVFMGCLFDDDHRLRKSKILSHHVAVDNVERMTETLKRFLLDQPVDEALPREQCVTTLNFDMGCDFSPEAYLSNQSQPVNAAFRAIELKAVEERASLKHVQVSSFVPTKTYPIHTFIEKEEAALVKTLKEYPRGRVPVVASTAKDNGVADWLDIPDELCMENCITISTRHNTKPCEAFWHPYRFAAVDGHALVIRPIRDFVENPLAILYVCESITVHNSWKYNYARSPKLHELEVDVPVTKKGDPDIKAMVDIVRRQLS